MMPNYNPKTHIHYGVIHQNSVLQAWADSSEGEYTLEDIELMAADSDIGSECEPVAFVYDKEGYLCSQGVDAPEIMVVESPYYTWASPCSPCFPNAGDLDTPSWGGFKTYCFGHDWYENQVAPFTVYDCKTNQIVPPINYDTPKETQSVS